MKNIIQGSEYEERLKIWKTSIIATKRHIKVGVELQKHAKSMIENLETLATNSEDAIKISQQAYTMIEKGIRIEREALQEMRRLHDEKPLK